MHSKHINAICLTSILLLASILRCAGLNAGLWYDEIVTLVEYVRLPTGDLVTTYTSLNNHVLYSLAAQMSIFAFGESAWALRLPAALFGVASIAALWFLARAVVGTVEAHLCALMMAVSYHHIWYSQNARGYTGLLFFALAATTLFVAGLKKSSWWLWLAYGVFFALSMYVHLSAVFLFAAHGFVYVCLLAYMKLKPQAGVNLDSPWGPAIGLTAGALMTLSLYATIIPQMVNEFRTVSTSDSAGDVAKWENPLWTVLEVLQSFREHNAIMLVGALVGGGIALIGVVDLLRHRPVFAWLAILPVPITLAGLLILSFRIWPRFFFADMGFALIFLIHGVFAIAGLCTRLIGNVDDRVGSSQRLGIVAVMLFVLGSLFMLPRNYRIPKQDLIGAREFVETRRQPNDIVASAGWAAYAYQKYYAPDWVEIETGSALADLRQQADSLWLIYSFPSHTAAKFPDVVEMLESDFVLEQSLPGTLGEGRVLIYKSH